MCEFFMKKEGVMLFLFLKKDCHVRNKFRNFWDFKNVASYYPGIFSGLSVQACNLMDYEHETKKFVAK